MKRIFTIATILLAWGLASAQEKVDTLFLSSMTTTHVRFESELSYVDIPAKNVVAKVIGTESNLLAIKAREFFPGVLSITVLEVNGGLHTYAIKYAEQGCTIVHDARKKTVQPDEITPKTIAEPTLDKPAKQRLFHIADVNYGITISCDDIYIQSDMIVFNLSVNNRSSIGFECSDAVFMIEGRKKVKRGLTMEKQLQPIKTRGGLSVARDSVTYAEYTFNKLSLTKDQILRVYIYERGGSRNYTLSMTANDINRARLSSK